MNRYLTSFMDILLEPFSNFGFDWICILRRIEKGAAVDDFQSHLNIGSDGTLARAPLYMRPQKGAPYFFLGPPISLKLSKNLNFSNKFRNMYFFAALFLILFCYKNDVSMFFTGAPKNFEPGPPNFLRRLC
jgi:hypothetical protein